MKKLPLKLLSLLAIGTAGLLGCAENKPTPIPAPPTPLSTASVPAATASPNRSASPASAVQLQLGSEPTRPTVDPSVNRAGRIHHHSHSARHPFTAAPSALNVSVPLSSRSRHRTTPHAPKPPRLTTTQHKSTKPKPAPTQAPTTNSDSNTSQPGRP